MPDFIYETDESTTVKDREKVEIPRRHRVLLHNDHYTTMDFVVLVLKEVFHKPHREAVRIMRNVHENGIGVAGVYARALAEAKIMTTHRLAREHGFPLKCSMEPE